MSTMPKTPQETHPVPLPLPPRERLNSSGLPPEFTSFVGRAEDVARLAALLRQPETRLVTLTGPGGVGKSRLAIRVSRSIETDFDLGVCFVPLAPITDPKLVAAEIGRALGVADDGVVPLATRFNAVLGGSSLLLVVDTFERLVSEAPMLVELLAANPALKILSTSRTLLHLTGEIEFKVEPLHVAAVSTAASTLSESAAMRLFADRAGIRVDASNVAIIGEICRRLDGLPLAIELAASRTRLFSLEELLSRLDQRLPLLADGPRDAPPLALDARRHRLVI